MTDPINVIVPIVALFGLLACGVPVGFSLGLSGGLGLIMVRGYDAATSTLSSVPLSTSASFELTAIPMFMLMGIVVSHAGMLDSLFYLAQRVTRRLPGGLAIASVGAAAIFGGISGSSAADAATIGRVSISQMSSRGYDKPYAAAVVASAATVDILIPPSIVLVIFGIVTSESVGSLLLAGIIPGIVTALVYMIVIFTLARSGRPGMGGRPPAGSGSEATSSADQTDAPPVGETVYCAVAGAAIFLVVVGGIYTGWVTATESASFGAAVSVVLSVIFLVVFRRGGGTGISAAMRETFAEAASLTSMVLLLVIGASIFAQYLILAGIPRTIAETVGGWQVWPPLVVMMFLLVLIPIGMFIDGLSIMLIVVPLAYPIVTDLGFDGIWFAILFVKMIEIALLTPPVGLNVYVVAGLFPDLSAESIFRRIVPFLAAELAVVVLLFSFPAITTWLPSIASVQG
jgi:tripartite ATP-independent transporter DctM subunit